MAKRQGVLLFDLSVPPAVRLYPPPPRPAMPAGPIVKLQQLEAIVRCSPSILTEDARSTFLTYITLTLADLGAPTPAPDRKAA
jgi:hypothetical protein